MQNDQLDRYISEINKAYLRGDATEHTHRPALKALIEGLAKKITATNEPKRTACGAPDYVVSRRTDGLDQTIGYVEAKDIGTNLTQAAKTEQIKKRYLPSLNNFILTDYIEFRWYVNSERQLTARLAEQSAGKFKATTKGEEEVREVFRAFFDQKPEKIKIAKELAMKMGHKARMMRDIIKKTFQQEEKSGTLHGQFEGFKQVLLHDLTEGQFADMYAQTICYGLFSARCHIEDMTVFGKDKYAAFHGIDERAKELTREHAAYLLPKTNPFFRDIFGDIAGPKLDDRIVWLVDDLVELLRQADMGVILRDFARRKKRKDPVFHFYETFVGAYDPKMRKKRGVYYTPDEVVSYIVRSVDYLLKTKFGLKRGLADESKIKGKALHRLLILDPAVGTGTFLFEVIEQIYERFRQQKGMWSGYVKEHLLPRIFGFELMMAPYAVCHTKLGLQLAETGYDFASDERLGIYLTNTLEEAEETSRTLFAQYLSKEAAAANKVKKDLPIMVVLGNPPYAGISANRGEWITNQINVYRQVDGQPLGEKKVWVKNDYIKFIRFGQWRIEQTGCGILGFITDHSYLDSPTFRGMRQNLMNCFDEIYILNLHGNSKRRETAPDGSKDENVFDITQGTAISILVKFPKTGNRSVYYSDLWGNRRNKYDTLLETNIEEIDWQEIEPLSPFYEFVPVNRRIQSEYDKGWKITEIFPIGSNGVQTSRDELVIATSPTELRRRFEKIRDLAIEDSVIKNEMNVEDRSFWKLAEARAELCKEESLDRFIKGYIYRPFDKQWIFASSAFVHRLRYNVMHHLTRCNVGLCVGRAGLVSMGPWDLVFCVNNVCDHNMFYRGSSMNCPLHLYPDKEGDILFDDSPWPVGKGGRVPNLAVEFVEEFAEKIKLEFVSDGVGDLKKTFGPEDVFGYIYGILHSPEYRRRYAEFLKIDFPRIPWPEDRGIFRKVCKVGGQLVKLHLMESKILEDEKRHPSFPKEGSRIVEKGYPKYIAMAEEPTKSKVYINKDQFLEGVRPDVWEFHIGGYQVCEKWLKDRRQRELSYEDISHYEKIVVALGETIRLMKQIDEIIDDHGGWPIK